MAGARQCYSTCCALPWPAPAAAVTRSCKIIRSATSSGRNRPLQQQQAAPWQPGGPLRRQARPLTLFALLFRCVRCYVFVDGSLPEIQVKLLSRVCTRYLGTHRGWKEATSSWEQPIASHCVKSTSSGWAWVACEAILAPLWDHPLLSTCEHVMALMCTVSAYACDRNEHTQAS